MSALQSEIYEAFRSIDLPEDKALKTATALSRRDEDIATGFAKRDAEIASIKGDLSDLKWMSGFTLAMIAAILGRMLVH